MSSQIQSFFGDVFGLSQNGLVAPLGSAVAENCNNCQLRADGGLEKRRGYQFKGSGLGGYGLTNYVYLDVDGNPVQELVLISNTLYKVLEGSLTIAYAGAQTHAVINLVQEVGNINFSMIANNASVLDVNLVNGYEESSPVTIASLKTSIDAITGFSSTIVGTTSTPAAYLDITPSLSIPKNTSKSIPFFYLQEVNKILDNPINNLAALQNSANLRTIPTANHKGLLIITDGSAVKVYDGQTVYKAGMPVPSTPILASQGSSGFGPGTYQYKITYEFTDNQGNITESAPSEVVSIVLASPKTVSMTIPYITAAEGYNTNCAIVVGTQSVAPSSGLVTLNVDDGGGGAHTLKAGDTAYMKNTAISSSSYRTYMVRSTTSSTITLESTETIGTSDNLVISNNLKVNIYRTLADGDEFHLLAPQPNNSFLTSEDLPDTVSDTAITLFDYSSSYIEPETTQGPPPDADFCTSFQAHLILGKGYNIYYSDEINNGITNSSLSFPGTQVLDILSTFGDSITGLGISTKTLCIFGKRTVHGLEGTLDNDDINTFLITDQFGSTSWASIHQLGSLLYFVNEIGVYTLYNGTFARTDPNTGLPVPESEPISPWFNAINVNNEEHFRLDRAIGVNDYVNRLFLLYVPSVLDESDLSTSNSKILVYDYKNFKWFFWSNMDMGGGAAIHDNKLWFSERKQSSTSRVNLGRVLNLGNYNDYWDHSAAIDWSYTTKWFNFNRSTGNQSSNSYGVYKKPLNVRVYSSERSRRDADPQGDIDITVYKDYIHNLLHSDVDPTFGDVGNAWGFRWGVEPFGSWREPFQTNNLNADLAVALKFSFTNTDGGKNINLSGFDVEWSNPYDEQLKA